MPDRAIAVIHTVASLTPNSGVTPVIQNNLRHRLSTGMPTCCIYFDKLGKAQHADTGLAPALCPIAETSRPWLQYTRFVSAITKAVQTFQRKELACVIHDHGLWLPSNLASARVAKDLGCAYVVSTHGMLQPAALQYAGVKKKLAWALYEQRRLRNAAAIHTTSVIEANAVRERLPHARIDILPLGLEVPVSPPTQDMKCPEVLYLGRLHPLKGLDLLLQAWAMAHQTGWTLRLVGPCEAHYAEHLKRTVNQLGIESSVTLEGPLYGQEKLRAFQKAAVFVLPSFSENFGMAVCEALSYGVPVLTTYNTPWQELVHRQCGWVVATTPAEMAVGLKQAMQTNMADLARMGRRGWEWARSDFDLPEITRVMNAFYRDLIHE